MTPIFLVATGEVHEGLETYTRHEGAPPPLCDFEGPLFSSGQAASAVPEGMRLVPVALLEDAIASIDDYRASVEFGASDRKLLGRLKAALASPTQPASAPAREGAKALVAEIKELVRQKTTAQNGYMLKLWEGLEEKIATALSAPAAPAQPRDDLREALEYALDCARQELASAQDLYGQYPQDGLGRKIKTAREQVEMVERAIAAIATPPAPRAPSIEPVGDDSIKLSVKRDEWEQLSPAAQKKLEEIVWKGVKEYRRQQAEGRAAILDKPLLATPAAPAQPREAQAQAAEPGLGATVTLDALEKALRQRLSIQEALERLTRWARTMVGNCDCTGDHPIAHAERTLGWRK